jgi:predicted PurR-regulated permease PerM
VDAESRERARVYRSLLVVGALVVVGWLLWSARGALFPFVLGAVIAYLLSPLVDRIERLLPRRGRLEGASRALSIVVVYLITLAILAGLVLTVGQKLLDETLDLVDAFPGYVDTARERQHDLQAWYEENVPAAQRARLEANVDELQAAVGDASKSVLLSTFGTLRRVLGFLTGLVLLPLWLYYVLKDEEKGKRAFYGLWPEHLREDVKQIAGIIDRVLGAYIRGQLFLGVVVGLVTGVGLWVIGAPQPVALGVLAGIFEMIPILGPWLSFIVAAVVVLATEPSLFLWVAVLFLLVQQLENTFLVPKIQGNAVNMNPAVIMVLLVVGGALYGVLGVIAIVPLAAIARDVFIYIYRRLGEAAGEPNVAALAAAGPRADADVPGSDAPLRDSDTEP